MSKIVAIPKIGEAWDSADPNDFVFHSNYNTFKIIVEATKTVTLSASTDNQSFTEAHNQPFIPLVRGFAKTTAVSRVFPPNFYDVSLWASDVGMASSGVQFNYMASDQTNIIFNFDNDNGSTKEVNIRYFVLEKI